MSTPAPDALLEHLKAMVAKARADQQESARLWANALTFWAQVDAQIEARKHPETAPSS